MLAFKLTVVSLCAVWESGKLLVEFTDGTLREYTHWGRPRAAYTGADPMRPFANLTHEQLVERCREANRLHQVMCNANLHLSKERRFGHGYAARGY